MPKAFCSRPSLSSAVTLGCTPDSCSTNRSPSRVAPMEAYAAMADITTSVRVRGVMVPLILARSLRSQSCCRSLARRPATMPYTFANGSCRSCMRRNASPKSMSSRCSATDSRRNIAATSSLPTWPPPMSTLSPGITNRFICRVVIVGSATPPVHSRPTWISRSCSWKADTTSICKLVSASCLATLEYTSLARRVDASAASPLIEPLSLCSLRASFKCFCAAFNSFIPSLRLGAMEKRRHAVIPASECIPSASWQL
mmetsp:Transcript_1400/g.4043  ORF Transcript_1400/g.4043 Transcript_1400/m.4043 type:complete len:256 (-) Transcript_1400:1885-2652(-)